MEPLSNAAGSLASLNNAISNGTAGQVPPQPLPPQTNMVPPVMGQVPQPQTPRPFTPPVPPPQQHTFVAPQPSTPQPQSRSIVVPIVISFLVLIIIVLAGLLYIYGSRLAQMQQGSTAQPTPVSETAPVNGFQVTESSVMEPNFDAQQGQDYQPNANADINTDVNNMFE